MICYLQFELSVKCSRICASAFSISHHINISIRGDYSRLEINKIREAKFAVYERGSRVQK